MNFLLPEDEEMMNKENASYLLQRLMDGEASSAERATLSQLLKEDYPEDQWIDLLEELFYAQDAEVSYNEEEWKPVLEELLKKTREQERKVIPMWRKIAVAAAVVSLILMATYFFVSRESSVVSPGEITVKANDVKAPDKFRASIKLADGTVIYLDSAGNGELANVNGVRVMKTEDGKVEYSGESGVGNRELEYNTLTNPRGSKVIHMTLADGSRVWLNAGSSVTYPVAFIGNERKVNIDGEAYFEIAHNASKPFIVSKNDVSITVLGTHFNVNAYDDEADIKVTLLEGSVRVQSSVVSSESKVIKPGEQAVAMVNGQLSITKDVNVDEVMAWKNGLFQFEETDINSLMRQIARWYNVNVIYQDKITKLFNGKIPRTMSAANVFKVLEETGGVRFKIEGNTVTVMK